MKGGIGDEGLPTHFHPGGCRFEVQAQGNGADGAHVGGDLFSLFAVPARCGSNEYAVFVAQGESVAIDFEFSHHGQGRRWSFFCWCAVKHLEQPAIPAVELVTVKRVVEAEQGNPVAHTAEPFG